MSHESLTISKPGTLDAFHNLAKNLLQHKSGTILYNKRAEKFCTRTLPWKFIPQVKDLEEGPSCQKIPEFRFCSEDDKRVSDVESFSWKWSPTGRFGVEAPGGRDSVGMRRNNEMAMFDLNKLNWTFYKVIDLRFEIPRMAFIYWVREDLLVLITLINDEPDGDEQVVIRFRQSFLYVDHTKNELRHLMTRCYDTTKTVSVSFWYHIFENRRGEPFEDENTDLWLVFSNSADCLILIPFIPTERANEVKYVDFDMDSIMKNIIGVPVHIDSFVCNHFVPWVYKSDVNFFVKIDEISLDLEQPTNEEERNASIEYLLEMKPKFGFYQVRIDLKRILKQARKSSTEELLIQYDDIRAYRKLEIDVNDHYHFTQFKNRVVVMRWNIQAMDKVFGQKVQSTVSKWKERWMNCLCGPGIKSYHLIDLDDGSFSSFSSTFLPSDVISPHPSGSMLMFRYKEDYGMRMCELPFFNPLSLESKCLQKLYNCVFVDPECSNREPVHCALHFSSSSS